MFIVAQAGVIKVLQRGASAPTVFLDIRDGILDIPGPGGTGAFSVASANVGGGGILTASVDTGSAELPLGASICQTVAATGACLAPPQPAVIVPMDAGATATFSVFAAGRGTIAFDPAVHRVNIRFKDGSGATRGLTSVAVRTR